MPRSERRHRAFVDPCPHPPNASGTIAPRMEVRSETQASGADVVVVPVAEGKQPPAGADPRVGELIASGEASAERAETTGVHVDGTRAAIARPGRPARPA